MFVSLKWERVFPNGEHHIQLSLNSGEVGVVPVYVFSGLEDDGTIILRSPAKRPSIPANVRRRTRASRRQEEKLAQSLGGIRHQGSGSRDGYKGDVRVHGKYRIEAKYTTKKSYSVTRLDLEKIRSECGLGEAPVFVIDFKEPETLRTEDSWVLIPRSEWEKHVAPTDD